MTITELGERALIARLRARMPSPPDWVVTGIGDDAAVLQPERGMVDVVTTDAMVEDIHFRRAWSAPEDIGHKALAVNLSDLAAMGAAPRALLLSLALPETLPLDDFDRILDGFLALAAQARVPLVGGNITRSPGPVVINVTAIGVAREKQPLPVLWLIGKAQAGKTSIIRALTGSETAQIGNGFQPCTRTARFYDFPNEAPVARFLDTRGLGEVALSLIHI